MLHAALVLLLNKEELMFNQEDNESSVVTLRPHRSKRKQVEEAGLPMEIKVRFVRVLLDTGEVEVLVTTLIDEEKYSAPEFKEIYNMRWGVETYYKTIKERLCLENFTGQSVEAVNQDFYSTIFVSNIESIFTKDVQKELDEKSLNNLHCQQVNKAVSFNAIKNHIIDLFYKERDLSVILKRLDELFKTNTVCKREGRKNPRHKKSPRKILNYYKRKKKICF